MSSEVLSRVAELLEEALNSDESMTNIVLCTKEGVVVTAVSRDEELDPRVLATVNAAIASASSNTFTQARGERASCLIHSTENKTIFTVLQPNCYMVFVTKGTYNRTDLEARVAPMQSTASRIALFMSSSTSFGAETLVENIARRIPGISKVLLLTHEGLPLGSLGFESEIEMAALASSIFGNGVTLSELTEHILIFSQEVAMLIARVDEKRLLLAICVGRDRINAAHRILDMIEAGA
ncbi:MAG: hypothetical protein HXY34_10665 [Candidatus Thorarchaeota archaeon]|nr:hypothetical protein [Candidatus Thorarchaeota archaeon]